MFLKVDGVHYNLLAAYKVELSETRENGYDITLYFPEGEKLYLSSGEHGNKFEAAWQIVGERIIHPEVYQR